jgi:hypothetical protein
VEVELAMRVAGDFTVLALHFLAKRGGIDWQLGAHFRPPFNKAARWL